MEPHTLTQKQVKDYHHLAIQDPFETDRNVARTVHAGGLAAVRDEFKRAHKIIEHLGFNGLKGHQLFDECRHTELDKLRR